MTKLVVAAGILIVIMLAFIFILFKNIIKRMDENAKKYLNRIEELTDTRISIVSVGPKRSQTIRVKEI